MGNKMLQNIWFAVQYSLQFDCILKDSFGFMGSCMLHFFLARSTGEQVPSNQHRLQEDTVPSQEMVPHIIAHKSMCHLKLLFLYKFNKQDIDAIGELLEMLVGGFCYLRTEPA